MVCIHLSSGSAGSEQDRPLKGTKTSTLISAPYPPDRMIPAMEIIIRILYQPYLPSVAGAGAGVVVGISEAHAGGPEKHPEQELSVTSQDVKRMQV